MKRISIHITILSLLIVLGLAACGGDDSSEASSEEAVVQTNEEAGSGQVSGDATAGQELFTATCSACHGPEGEGVPNLGKDMTASEFIAGKSDEELIAFIKVGRDPSDPLNTTGVAMPPKGGNPALSDEDLQDIVTFIRTIHNP
jgi:disulfide bond formation protein DsbB